MISTPFTIFCCRRQFHNEAGEVTREINCLPAVSFYRLTCQKRIGTLLHPVFFALRIIIIIICTLTHKRLSAAHVSLLMSYPASFVHPSPPPTHTHIHRRASRQRGTLIKCEREHGCLFLNVNTRYSGGVCVCVGVAAYASVSVGGVHICEWACLLHPHITTQTPTHSCTHTHTSAELSRLVIVLRDLMTLRLRPPLPLSLPRCIRRFIRRVLHS